MCLFPEAPKRSLSCSMDALNLPRFDIQVKEMEKGIAIFDVIRKKYVQLTPEEWVRQHFIHYLINQLHYPKSLMKVESGLKYNKLLKRSDILVYNRSGHPFLLVECKASGIKLDDSVIYQGATYNKSIRATYMAVTNGMHYLCAKTDVKDIVWAEELPDYPR